MEDIDGDADPETMEAVPSDGETMGELMLRGNTVMKGYLKNPRAATDEAFAGRMVPDRGPRGARIPTATSRSRIDPRT